MSMTENKALLSALEKVKAQKVNFGFLERFDVDENWEVTKALEEIQQYRAIGTVEEFKELKEKATAKPIEGKRFVEAICPKCGTELFDTYWAFGGIHYCANCGTAIDWS